MFSFSVSRVVRLVSAAGATAVTAISMAGATPAAAAAPGAGVLTGIVNLPVFPGAALSQAAGFCADGLLGGVATVDGIANPAAASTACTNGGPSVTTTYGYSEPCATDIAVGLAQGEIHQGGSAGTILQYFVWNRVGLTAIVLTSNNPFPGGTSSTTTGHVIGTSDVLDAGGVAAAVFVPLSAPGGCAPVGSPGPFRAYIATIGAWSGLK